MKSLKVYFTGYLQWPTLARRWVNITCLAATPAYHNEILYGIVIAKATTKSLSEDRETVAGGFFGLSYTGAYCAP